MKFQGWKEIQNQISRYNTRHTLIHGQANYNVRDKKGREVGHSVYIIPYDHAADVAMCEKENKETDARGWGGRPKPEGTAETKFTASFHITRNNECYGATQRWKLLSAQTLDDAKTEVLAHLAKHWKTQVKKWGPV